MAGIRSDLDVAVVFVPSVFALGLLFFPQRTRRGHALVVAVRHRRHARRQHRRCSSTITMRRRSTQRRVQNARGASRLDVSLDAPRRARRPRRRATAQAIRQRLASRAIPWIRRFNIDYYLGVDGISMPLILLTTVLFFLSMIASLEASTKHVRTRLLHAVPAPRDRHARARSWRSTSSCSTSSGK